jgi:hypothetical protein
VSCATDGIRCGHAIENECRNLAGLAQVARLWYANLRETMVLLADELRYGGESPFVAGSNRT